MIYKILFHLTLGISLVSEQYDQVPHMSVFDASTMFEFILQLHSTFHLVNQLLSVQTFKSTGIK